MIWPDDMMQMESRLAPFPMRMTLVAPNRAKPRMSNVIVVSPADLGATSTPYAV
jgi:hypothetical protein